MNIERSSSVARPAGSWLSGIAGQVALVLAGTTLLALSAKISVPFFPVPMTFQSLVVLLIGAAFGPRLGALTLAAYLVEGAAGLPVFAGTPEKGIGIAYMVGPTGGFLLGFLLAATLVGWMVGQGAGRSVWAAALVVLAGSVAVYMPGLLWLGAVVGWDKPVLEWGLYPFLYGDALKLVIASLALPVVAGRLSRG
ncbi:MAG: biotin transporter BioY [Mesorhizobium sp.]|nr:biotin transporter BioY [Mesorhizobium sp.]MCO5164105.1 biotin transporter BioY [Mesorhizobium sp.]